MQIRTCIGFLIFEIFSFVFLQVQVSDASTFANFDFTNNDVTQGFSNWHYSDIGDNSCGIYAGEQQSKLCSDPNADGNKQGIYLYYNGYNTDHMGWMRYGYIDSSSTAISGNSLKITLTGGAYNDNGQVAYSGTEVKSKSQLDSYLNLGENPYADMTLPGGMYMYFSSNDKDSHYTPFDQFLGNDRFSMWVLPPEESTNTLDNNSLVYKTRPDTTFSWYPFVVDSNGDHYYHNFANINMGDWIHFIFDAHPQHNNSGDTNPYSYYRSGGYDFPGDGLSYFNNVDKFALTAGFTFNTTSPSSMYIDQMESYKQDEPQNDETINSIGVGYDSNNKIFDISFNDKYMCSNCNATYEVRYSFQPITNANYSNATLCKVTNFDRSKNNNNGIIYKPNPGYEQIWAALQVNDADVASLAQGNTIYFAVKDISDRSNLPDRDTYDLQTVNVAGVGQVARQDLIKSIDYKIYPLFRQLYIDGASLQNGHKGEQYSDQIAVKGGAKPYVFSLVSGALPDGLTLSSDGTISGTPTVVGTFIFKINVNESSTFAQQVSQDFTLNIYNPENCSDGIDNDNNGLVDCADPACFSDPVCSVELVDFAQPNIFGLSNWNTLLKDVYTNYINIGPGGMSITVGTNGAYDFQGVQGALKKFGLGDRIVAFWYNNSSSQVSFVPKISFNDSGRPGINPSGIWYSMSQITVDPQKIAMSVFVFDQSTAGSYSLVNVNSNHNDNEVLICDKINLVSKGFLQKYAFSDFVNLTSGWFHLESGNPSDLNYDNIVNTKDLGIMMSKWN